LFLQFLKVLFFLFFNQSDYFIILLLLRDVLEFCKYYKCYLNRNTNDSNDDDCDHDDDHDDDDDDDDDVGGSLAWTYFKLLHFYTTIHIISPYLNIKF
jgi:hypothetical protein